MSLRQKIDNIIAETLPEGATYTLSLSRSGINDTFIVRVVTPAWKSLAPFLRALRIQNALQQGLTPQERQQILRVSVFSPEALGRLLLQNAVAKSGQKKNPPNLPSWEKIAAKLRQHRLSGNQKKPLNKALLRAALAKLSKKS